MNDFIPGDLVILKDDIQELEMELVQSKIPKYINYITHFIKKDEPMIVLYVDHAEAEDVSLCVYSVKHKSVYKSYYDSDFYATGSIFHDINLSIQREIVIRTDQHTNAFDIIVSRYNTCICFKKVSQISPL